MFDRLTAVKIRCGITLSCWQQVLSAFGFLCLLAIILATGFYTDSPDRRLSSLRASSPVISTSFTPSSELLTSHPIRRQMEGEAYSLQYQTALSPQSSHEVNLLRQESGTKTSALSPSQSGAVPLRLPGKVGGLDSEDRKKLFIDLLLPTVMVALEEVKQERHQLLTIISELGGVSTDLTFSEKNPAWQQQLGVDKSRFILGLTRKYRTDSADKLLFRINVLPPSLIIAQGAIESGWGSSRVAIEVNNFFGMYSYTDPGPSSLHDGDNMPKIIEYETILDSVRSYILNINRLSAYNELRQIRCQTLDPMLIAEGLAQYSTRKEFYIADLKHIIIYNNLQDLDSLVLGAV